MKRVLIDTATNEFYDIVDPGNEFAVVFGYEWVDGPDNLTKRWTYNGSSFVQPASKTKEDIVVPIKETANLLIEKEVPIWKQINQLRRYVQLTRGVIGDAEAAEILSIQKAWGWIDEMRAISNTAETNNSHPDNVAWTSLKSK